MYRIDNSTASTVLPTPKPVGAPGYFTCGSIGGEAATIVEADWLNQVQEELMAILAADGLAPNKTQNNQVITAILDLIAKSTRLRLTAPLILYVNAATGSDANNGLTPATAFATPQGAWTFIMDRLDCGSQQITVQIAAGVYQGFFCSGKPLGNTAPWQITFTGDPANPGAAQIQALGAGNGYAIAVLDGAEVTFQNMSVTGWIAGFGVTNGGRCYIGDGIIFGACGTMINAYYGGLCQLIGNITINANASQFIWSIGEGYVGFPAQAPAITIVLNGNPSFSQAFILCEEAGYVNARAAPQLVTFQGTAQGKRYAVDTAGIISVRQGTTNFFPGNQPGSVDTTTYGQYLP